MWPKFDYIFNFFYPKNDADDIKKELERVLELAQTECQEYQEAHCIKNEDDELDEITEDKCVLSNGKITSLSHEAGMINRDIPFSLSKAYGLHLSEGQTVSYMWYKADNDVVKVCRIVKIIEENWNEPLTDEAIEEVRRQRPEVFSTYLVSKVGFISRKLRDIIDVDVEGEESKQTFSLDDIEATFTPRRYDQVTIVCKVQRDPKLLDEAGVTIEVIKMEPNITKQYTGTITNVTQGQHGLIAEKFLFFWDALVSDYRVVNVGDKVTAECIQCEIVDASVYEFRCLKVVLIESVVQVESESQIFQPVIKPAENKNGIEMSDNVTIELNEINEIKEFTMLVKNTAAVAQKVLETVFVGRKSESQLTLISPARNHSFDLQPNEETMFKFQAKGRIFGESPPEKFYIRFSGPAGVFKIFRNIIVILQDVEQIHPFIGTGSNVQKNLSYTQRVARMDATRSTIQGVPVIKTANFVKTKFKQWAVPDSMKAIVNDPKNSRNYINETLDSFWPLLKANLDVTGYCRIFHTLLHLEECEMYHNMRRYDKKSFFKREGEYLSLTVQNIAESRPSLVIGDSVKVFSPFSSQAPGQEKGFEGCIHGVKKDRILLKFNDAFHAKYNSEDYNIYFYFSRTPLRKQHHAIDLIKNKLPEILFANKVVTKEKQLDVQLNVETGELLLQSSVIPWFNPELNIVQKQAVTNILQGVARPLPYVIFGPPGTGKTVTLIETILQLYKKVPHSRILVATPSNSSANLITERIVESGALMQGEFIRLVSENSIQKETIPESIIRHCGTIDIAREETTDDGIKLTVSGLKMNCNSKYLRLRRVLIGTCITLGTLMQCDFPENHFTHVIIDESGQSMETEIVIPMSFVDKRNGQIILAGDPMQLGPIVLSSYAKSRGLDQSYLVRLLERTPYKPDPERFERRFDPRLITRLVFNYRSLPSIMSIYSELFYDSDLKAMVNDVDSIEAELVKRLRPIFLHPEQENVTQGVIFIGVQGKSQQCADSPSWFNAAEANNVLQFMMKLMKYGCDADDIGIITPYTQQVKTIRNIIESTDLIAPKVGTVEEFQGQERKIILVSTVRTVGREIRQTDKKHNLGFVKSPKRMNVAISRARALLVIFGSPRILVQDENWKFLIEQCAKNDSCMSFDPAILNVKAVNGGRDDDDDDDDDDN
ncbi:probable RNA helicase armi [Bradysia coprophila]|uniref:probable RNA helicase armi n=1 Tax=Bradysia coprophila TaxID=38358 RepID=UPI00187DCC55|nr:probable RNA helicase armi [Bradysia coprophila]